MLSFQQAQAQQSNAATMQQQQTNNAQQQANHDQQSIQNTLHHLQQQQSMQQQQQQQQHQQPTLQSTMRLREDPPTITPPASRPSRKRKSPATSGEQQAQQQPPPPVQQPPPQQLQHVIPGPPHTILHPPHPHGMVPAFAYPAVDYTPGGLPQGIPGQPSANAVAQPAQQNRPASASSPGASNGGRTLSNSKRAEQNRKAQRAFRERRDQHVKFLESRSQLLDAALQSADEANRRWEECRALVDQLRVENAALRAALSHAGLLPGGAGPVPPATLLAAQQEATKNGEIHQAEVDGSASGAGEQKQQS